jgi:two-component system sensor histidine kinase YesM
MIILLFLCIPFLIGGILWYEESTAILEKNAVSYTQQLVNQINNHFDSYFDDLERTTYPLIMHPHVLDFMKLDSAVGYDYIYLNGKIQEELIPNYIFGRDDIYSLSIVNENGLVATYGEFTPRSLLRMNPESEFTSNYAIQGIRHINGKPVLTVARLFKDTQTYSRLGKIVIYLEMKKIASIADNVQLGETGFIWIIGADDRIIYHPDMSLWGQPAMESDLEEIRSHPEGNFIKLGEDGKERLVIFNHSSENEWTLVSEVPLHELMRHMEQLRDITLIGGAILIIFVLIVLMVYTYHFTRNLLNLQRLMNKAEQGILNIKAPEHRNDEIGRLNRSFNTMVTEIRRLIEVIHVAKLREKELQIRQREATMKALHSQINPHFLYNTLEVINSYAIVENVQPISRMATALAKIFRYSVGNPHQIVPLANELDHIHTYFDIQKERYPHLAVDFQVNAEEIHDVRGVQLMLQPLVENAIVHGYENHKLRPQYIGIIGVRADEAYHLHVVDHGGGMPEHVREKFNRQFTAEDPDTADEPVNSIGVWNVHQRIRLHFGEQYGLHIVKSDGTGTDIQIILPYAADLESDKTGGENDVQSDRG